MPALSVLALFAVIPIPDCPMEEYDGRERTAVIFAKGMGELNYLIFCSSGPTEYDVFDLTAGQRYRIIHGVGMWTSAREIVADGYGHVGFLADGWGPVLIWNAGIRRF